ncbi:MAG TPA: hypothetical protein VG407_08495 [Caulobacteraceae bacterium]|jgi:hypothetical protein|nr:hypothetical protein [Caulobacteraceae bacterium]
MKRIDLSGLLLLSGQAAAGFGAAVALSYAVWRAWQMDAHALVEGIRSLEIGFMNLSLVLFAAFLWPRLRAAKARD